MFANISSSNSKHRSVLALGGAILLAIMVFLTIPMTQQINNRNQEIIDLREILVVPPPALIEPPNAPKPNPTKEQPSKPEFQRQSSDPTLKHLELSLNPGIDDALAIGLTNAGFEIAVDAVDDIEKLFTFSDLSESPRIINYPRIQYPQELVRRGIKEGRAVVLIEIDEQGRAKVISVKSSTHPQLVRPAKEVIRQAQFTKPLVDGVPRKIRGEWSINLSAPN